MVKLSCVVHNAAIYERISTPEAAAKTIATNVFGPLRLTQALLPVLTDDARLVLVSSSLGLLHGYSPAMVRRLESTRTVAEVEVLAQEYLAATASGASATQSADAAQRAGFSRDSYGVSKALINALARAFAVTWPRRTVVAASPGWVQTDMGGSDAPRPASSGIARLVEATTAKVRSGAFYADGDSFEG
jgi:carbonyl reductase 1